MEQTINRALSAAGKWLNNLEQHTARRLVALSVIVFWSVMIWIGVKAS